MPKKFAEMMDAGWYWRLKPCLESPYFHNLLHFIEKERLHNTIYPNDPETAFKAFRITPFDETKVVILGQDPYHDGRATGLCFANPVTVGAPSPSLRIILHAVMKDHPVPSNAIKSLYSLEHWARQGVLLLNTALTVRKGTPGSHSEQWKEFTKCVLKQLGDGNKGIIYVLWGKHAQAFEQYINGTENHILKASHPMYAGYSAKPWDGAKHFDEINDILLKTNGKHALIEWL